MNETKRNYMDCIVCDEKEEMGILVKGRFICKECSLSLLSYSDKITKKKDKLEEALEDARDMDE